MAEQLTIDKRSESAVLRSWIGQKISAMGETTEGNESQPPISAIVALYSYVQAGWIGLDFNTSEEFEFDGDISKAAWDDLLRMPVWQEFADSEGDVPITFVEADGTLTSIPVAEQTDEILSAHFGEMIADVLTTAWEEGLFSSLMLKPGCVLSVNDFYGNWGWETAEVAGKVTGYDYQSDDRQTLVVHVVASGPHRDQLFGLYRRVLGVSPREAKDLLDAARVEVARGPRMAVEGLIREFQAVGATLDVAYD